MGPGCLRDSDTGGLSAGTVGVILSIDGARTERL